jgi:Holliday junction resolvase RusA-like endonuclease
MLYLKLDGNPVPAARPKVSRWGTYYPATYRAFRSAMDLLLRKMFAKREPMAGPLEVSIGVYVKRPKTSKLLYPMGDCDNYAKSYLDSLNGHAWHDDRQVIKLSIFKEFAPDGTDGWADISIKQVNLEEPLPKVQGKRARRKR